MRISDWSSRRVLFRSILAGTAGGSDGTDSLAGIGFDFENIGFCLQESAWIDRLAVQADFEMQVAAGRTAGRAHFRSEERRVGHKCVSKCRSRWSPKHQKNTNK